MSARARVFTFAVELDTDGTATSELGGDPLPVDGAWTPEHLVLAAVCRCTLASLAHHAARAGVAYRATSSASGVVTRRESDSRFAFVEIDLVVALEFDEVPGDDVLGPLVAKAERDCFVGASLTAKPRYEWTANGKRLEPVIV